MTEHISIWAIIAVCAVSAVIGGVIGGVLSWVILKADDFIFRNWSSEREIAMHEAGHVLAWLKYCPWWSNDYAYFKHAERMECVCVNNGSKCGYLSMSKTIDFNGRTEINKMVLLGGMAVELILKKRKPSLFRLWMLRKFFGCASDQERLIEQQGLSKKEIISLLKEQIEDIDEYDIWFVNRIADSIMVRGKDDEGTKTLGPDRLRQYASHYYAGEMF